jgi:hypothetical protein
MHTICHQANTPAAEIFVTQVNLLPDPYRDWQLTLTCLQGLVNRDVPQVFLSLDLFDRLWLDWLAERGDVEKVRDVSAEELLNRFLPAARGLVITDPDVAASRNVATMLAGVEQRLVVTPGFLDAAGGQIPAALKQDSLDLRSFGWRRDLDAYRWFYAAYGDRLTDRMCAFLSPEATAIRDYLVAFKLPVFWLSETFDAADADLVQERLLALPPNIPCLGWPGYPIGKDEGIGEAMGATMLSECAKFTVCAAFQKVSQATGNLTVHSGTRATLSHRSGPAPKLDRSKVYIAFIRTDGDSPDFYRQDFRKLWEDPDHGRFPMGWQLSPILLDLIPDILDWFFQHATPNDGFTNAVTGVGYIHEWNYAGRYPEERRRQIWHDYVALSQAYRERLGLDTLVTYYDMPEERLADLCRSGVRGVFKNYDRSKADSLPTAVRQIAGIPVIQASTVNPSDNRISFHELLGDVRKWTPRQRPGFVYASVGNWLTQMDYVRAMLERLGEGYVPVTPDQLVDLYWQSKRTE